MAGPDVSLYESLGGLEGCRRLSAAFYARVARDPVLRPIFPASFHCAIEAFATFLAQFLGGPCVYSPQRWYLSLYEAHLRFPIGERERDAWLSNMEQVLSETGAPAATCAALREFFAEAANSLMNRPAAPHKGRLQSALASHWDGHLALEETVAAVRAGDPARTAALLESGRLREYFERDPAARVALLAIMMRSPAFFGLAAEILRRDSQLARAQYVRGRTLLCDAAAAGNLPMAKLLLELGADSQSAALYHLANESSSASAAAVVRLLVNAGGAVNSAHGVKQCTALHMAARRGNLRIAEALLDSGAHLEARDSQGETPLRRAVNCGKTGVAALLLSRGADANSCGSKGLTPRTAARTTAMKAIFEK